MTARAIVFDAYGTLFDVRAVVLQHGHNLGVDAEGLAALWRQRQLEYTWLVSLMGRYEDFWSLTKTALYSAARELHIALTDTQRDGLLQSYLSAPVFPEVNAALDSLKEFRLAILSNGSPDMLAAAVRAGGLSALFSEVISVDRAKAYKPSPSAYALGPEILNLPEEDILFVSSNWWDVWGAKSFGFNVCWCNRSGAAVNFTPELVVTGLDQIAPKLA
jgi:2-haloacid dehalogenase